MKEVREVSAEIPIEDDEPNGKPVDTDEPVARVAALLTRRQRLRQMSPVNREQVPGLLGVQGGVGTTTVALSLTAALAEQESRVRCRLRGNAAGHPEGGEVGIGSARQRE